VRPPIGRRSSCGKHWPCNRRRTKLCGNA
jgi:hypothetical protein